MKLQKKKHYVEIYHETMKSNDEYSLQLQINGIDSPYLSATLRASNA